MQKPGPVTAAHSLSMKSWLCRRVHPARKDRINRRTATLQGTVEKDSASYKYALVQFSCSQVRANQERLDSNGNQSRESAYSLMIRNFKQSTGKLIVIVLWFPDYLWLVFNMLGLEKTMTCKNKFLTLLLCLLVADTSDDNCLVRAELQIRQSSTTANYFVPYVWSHQECLSRWPEITMPFKCLTMCSYQCIYSLWLNLIWSLASLFCLFSHLINVCLSVSSILSHIMSELYFLYYVTHVTYFSNVMFK